MGWSLRVKRKGRVTRPCCRFGRIVLGIKLVILTLTQRSHPGGSFDPERSALLISRLFKIKLFSKMPKEVFDVFFFCQEGESRLQWHQVGSAFTRPFFLPTTDMTFRPLCMKLLQPHFDVSKKIDAVCDSREKRSPPKY